MNPRLLSRATNRLARAWARARPAGFDGRWVVGLTAVVIAAAVALLWFAPNDTINDWVWLENDRKFPADQSRKIEGVLAGAEIDVQIDKGRIAVPRSKLREAHALIAKHKLGATSVNEIWKDLEDVSISSLLEDSAAHAQRGKRALERALGVRIEEIDESIISADVLISRTEPRGRRLFDSPKVQVSVFLGTEAGQEIEASTIEAIKTLLLSGVPELKQDGITVMDREKRQYLVAGRPNITRLAMRRAREEQLSGMLTKKLHWIDGIHITVSLQVAQPSKDSTNLVEPADLPAEPVVVVGINTPVSRTPVDQGGKALRSSASSVREDATESGEKERANVLVLVPRGHYVRAFREAEPGREPSVAELKPFQSRVEEAIRVSVRQALANDEQGKLEIETIPEPAPIEPPARPIVADTEQIKREWWIAAVGLGAGCALVVGLVAALTIGGRRLVTRQSARSPRVEPSEDSDESTGPSALERVRDLVRFEPKAAAGVLQRWIGQEERVA